MFQILVIMKARVLGVRQASRKTPRIFYYLSCFLTITGAEADPLQVLRSSSSLFLHIATVGDNTTSDSEPSCITLCPPSAVIIGGTTYPRDRNGESDLGVGLSAQLKREDIFLSMVNISTNDVLWTYRDGSSANDALYTMQMDPSGRYLYAGGRTFGNLHGSSNFGQSDMFIIKYEISEIPGNTRTVWKQPFILGSGASDILTHLKLDPQNENILYGVGSTRGSLFPDKMYGGGSSDAVMFKMNSQSGEIMDGVQFGSADADSATGLVFDESSDIIFVSVSTERSIGEYSLSNFHLYKLSKSFEMLGDVLLRSFSREQMAAFSSHPILNNTLLVSGASRLDSRNGFDMFLKRIVTKFDGTNISSTEMDIDEVKHNEYTQRYGSRDNKHDYASAMEIFRGGGVMLGGYSGGSFTNSTSNSDSFSGVLAFIDARTGQLLDARQMNSSAGGWTDIAAMETTDDESLVFYTGRTRSKNGSIHTHIGKHRVPPSWRRTFGGDASVSPTPTVSPAQVGATKHELSGGVMVGIGIGCAAAVAALVAILWWVWICRKRRTVGVYDERVRERVKRRQESDGAVDEPVNLHKWGRVVREGENCGGLV